MDEQSSRSALSALQNIAPAQLTAAIVAVIPPSVIAWIASRKLKRERSYQVEDATADRRDKIRSMLDTQSLSMMDRLEHEIERLNKDLVAIRQDRDKGWNFARLWNSKAHEVK